MKKRIKVCFAASSGGHYEQLLMLRPLMEEYDSFILTEKTPYNSGVKGVKTHFVLQVNREEWDCWPRLMLNAIISAAVFIRERPNIVICTGVLAMIPMCLLVKIFGGKLIYIESFAKITSPTETGKLMYKVADQFYVQWETMRKFYPDAIYLGGIY